VRLLRSRQQGGNVAASTQRLFWVLRDWFECPTRCHGQ